MAGRIACFLIIPLFIWGWSGSSGQDRSRLRISNCKGLSAIAGQSCYTLSVKENRNDPNSRFIDIFAVVLMALNENPTGSPYFYMAAPAT